MHAPQARRAAGIAPAAPNPATERAKGAGGMHQPVRVVVFGAHPDDDDIKVGGTAALWADRGDQVLFVALTCGDAGHQTMAGGELARRRRAEAQAAAAALGVRYLVCDHHDGALQPTLALRDQVIGIVREARADLVLLPRPWDYHPDHRAVAQVVQDAAYMVTVPNVTPLVPHLERNPVFAYVSDRFTRPNPFQPDVVVDTTASVERKLDALACHVSQLFEWLPYNAGTLDQVPADPAGRRRWMQHWVEDDAAQAERCRALLAERYGPIRAAASRYAEAFECCELGRRVSREALDALFPR